MESKQETPEESEEPSIIQDRLNWKLAWRDDVKVAQGLYAGEEIEEMHELSDAGLLDEFFVFLQDMGMLQAFEQVSMPGVKRILVPTVQFVLLYLLKVLVGGESMHELPRVLFSDLGLMELVGFNAQQCEDGLTKRGDAQRTTKQKQGPISAQCLAENISKLTEEEMERLFNQMVQVLAQQGMFSGELLVALDGSQLPTPKSYEGCGKLKQTRKVKVKGQQEAATEEYYVYGWKVLVLIEVQTRLPLAMKLVKIQEYEGSWLLALLEQAQRNLGEQAHIGTIVIDRGYLDGADLWQVHQRGIIFVIVGKANMTVVQDAQGLAKGERAVVRCFFTLLVMGLCTAFRLWQVQTATSPTPQTTLHPTLSSALLNGEGTARWRKRLREENRDKIIVFIGQAYGIFHLAEFAILTHLPLRRLPSPLGSPQAILQHFGIGP